MLNILSYCRSWDIIINYIQTLLYNVNLIIWVNRPIDKIYVKDDKEICCTNRSGFCIRYCGFDELNLTLDIQIYLLSCVGFIEIELVFNIDMQSVKARSQSIRQGLYQNIFGGLMQFNTWFLKIYSKNKTWSCLKNEFIT